MLEMLWRIRRAARCPPEIAVTRQKARPGTEGEAVLKALNLNQRRAPAPMVANLKMARDPIGGIFDWNDD